MTHIYHLGNVEVGDNSSGKMKGMLVINSIMISHAGLGTMKVGSSKFLGGDFFTCGSLKYNFRGYYNCKN